MSSPSPVSSGAWLIRSRVRQHNALISGGTPTSWVTRSQHVGNQLHSSQQIVVATRTIEVTLQTPHIEQVALREHSVSAIDLEWLNISSIASIQRTWCFVLFLAIVPHVFFSVIVIRHVSSYTPFSTTSSSSLMSFPQFVVLCYISSSTAGFSRGVE
jgi:hypothetical protein